MERAKRAGRSSRPGVGADPLHDDLVEKEVEAAFLAVVDQGRRRMSRRLGPLLATGMVGGIDVGTGVLALLLVEARTNNPLFGGLAFSIGFIALTLAKSELFTEDFLIPVSAVIARQVQFRRLLRLWTGTLAANLAGGWIFTWLIVHGFPSVQPKAIQLGSYYVHLGFGVRAFSLATMGGAVITLMTWMQYTTDTPAARIVAAVAAAFLLGAGRLDHAIVNSLLMFAALQSGHAPFGYAQWAVTAGFAALGNLFGGVGLVTALRLFQVPHKLREERANPALGVPVSDHRRDDVANA